jgi:hypothetical protein
VRLSAPPGVRGSSTGRAIAANARPQWFRLEEPHLLREHDCLHAVAEVELLNDVRDVCLDGGLADAELVPDLRIREGAVEALIGLATRAGVDVQVC